MTSFGSLSRWVRGAVVFAVLGLFGATPSQAQPARDFRQHYEAALRQYDSGQYEGAIKEFQAAYALKQLPRLLLNIGQAHRKLGHARDALGFYEFYLRVDPNPKPEIKAELTTYITQTRTLLEAAERMRALQDGPEPVPANEPPAVKIPASPAPNTPPAGPSAVAVAATPAERLPAGALTPAAARTSDSAAGRPVYKKWWFWTLIGVGAAAAATGIALGVRAPAYSDPTNIEIRNVF